MRTKVEIEQENFCFGIIIQSIDWHSCVCVTDGHGHGRSGKAIQVNGTRLLTWCISQKL